MQDFDITVVGGGLTGLTLALATVYQARQAGVVLSIAIIESKACTTTAEVHTVALSQGTQQWLQRWQLWPTFLPHVTPIKQIHVAEQGGLGMLQFSAREQRLHALGYVATLGTLVPALFEIIKNIPEITLFCPASVQKLSSTRSSHTLELNDGSCLQTQMILATDGVHSTVRRLLQLPIEQTQFQQSALMGAVTFERAHQGQAFERFTADGPLALLPVDTHCMSMVWAMSPAQLKSRQRLSPLELQAELQQAFGYRLGRITNIGTWRGCSLNMTVMPRFHDHRCLFLGNAAQTLHPIAGQGFNLGIRDIADWLRVLNPKTYPAGLGATASLHQYVALRTQDKQQTIQAVSFLVRCFSNRLPILKQGRQLGLSLCAIVPPLKRALVHRALGWHYTPMEY
jgi:2-octaprenyl-6-methoxyphenol hydroxylase